MSCCCPPSCATPSCPKPCCPKPCCPPCCPPCGYPTGGLGSLSCCPSPCCPPSCCGSSTPARCLGITSGASVSCINQIPPSEVTIQPPPCTVVVPGPVLAASCEPLRVGGYTACGGCPPCGCIC
ncbi:PREDICTED: keratin-associated protein 5-5-like [Gekko japonicus]|uniref:Keratin-associated protein 5-5-like n=1 Tax=Gekko japonicus TaxID=146911 RepID=A0ABM1KQW6_GEKJA|nr:PREDICTED: keratin-associated protein 5-5-like [Gekko japonicus]